MNAFSGSTAELVEDVLDLGHRELTTDVLHMARLCVLDWLGCTIAGAADSGPRLARHVWYGSSAGGRSTVIGGASPLDAAAAAHLNGHAAHTLEFGDLHPYSYSHPSATVLAAALAVAQERDLSLADVLRALVVGYEVMARIGLPVGERMFRDYHVHPQGFLGHFGASAAAGLLMGLSRDQLVGALGIAGSQAGGLLASAGTMTEGLTAGYPAAAGVQAARLAAVGYEGPRDVLNGHSGVFAAFAEPPGTILVRDPENPEILANAFKLHPCCGFSHPMIEAVLGLRDELPPAAVAGRAGVQVSLWRDAADHIDRARPTDVLGAQFSAQFCAAVALVDGRVGLAQFAEERLSDPVVLQAMGGVEVLRRHDLNRLQASVRIEVDGRYWEAFVDQRDRPPPTDALMQKYLALVAPRIGTPAAERLAHLVLGPTSVGTGELLEACTP